MRTLDRRRVLIGLAALAATPAFAKGRYSVQSVDVRVSPIVASRTRTDIAGRIASVLRGRSGRGGRPVRVVVELRTIDRYEPTQTYTQRRGIAVRYQVIDASTGRTVASSRFIERTRPREDDIGTVLFATRPITAGTQERELARGVAGQILRDLS